MLASWGLGLLLLLGWTGCGRGGGSNDGRGSAVTLQLVPQGIKTFHFTWTGADGATDLRLLESPDGASSLVDIATIAPTATYHDLPVSLPKRINARYVLRACDAVGCTDSPSVAVAGTLADAVGYVKASNTGERHRFGAAVAVSGDGDTLAVGAMWDESSATGIDGDQLSTAAQRSGAVHVFTRSAGAWSQQAFVKASNTGSGDYFGVAVALSADGDTLAVGAPFEDGASTTIGGDGSSDGAPDSGAAYVFARSGSAWSEQAYVKASNTGSGDAFGSEVALSADGNTLAVGAPFEDGAATGVGGNGSSNGATDSGAVYVYARSGAAWAHQAYVKASNTGPSDWFGSAVALSANGDALAAGAPGEDSAATGVGGDETSTEAWTSGAVYLFARAGATWAQQAYVKASNTGAGDQFGSAVALSGGGDTLVVGAPYEASAATGIGGDPGSDGASESGAVYVFASTAEVWSQQTYIKASNTGAGDRFGGAVALSSDGGTLAVGASGESGSARGIGGDQAYESGLTGASGAVYVFTSGASSWHQRAYVKASNTDGADLFGATLALSGDGDVLAVGAPDEGGGATGIGGDQTHASMLQSGAVYLY